MKSHMNLHGQSCTIQTNTTRYQLAEPVPSWPSRCVGQLIRRWYTAASGSLGVRDVRVGWVEDPRSMFTSRWGGARGHGLNIDSITTL